MASTRTKFTPEQSLDFLKALSGDLEMHGFTPLQDRVVCFLVAGAPAQELANIIRERVLKAERDRRNSAPVRSGP